MLLYSLTITPRARLAYVAFQAAAVSCTVVVADAGIVFFRCSLAGACRADRAGQYQAAGLDCAGGDGPAGSGRHFIAGLGVPPRLCAASVGYAAAASGRSYFVGGAGDGSV